MIQIKECAGQPTCLRARVATTVDLKIKNDVRPWYGATMARNSAVACPVVHVIKIVPHLLFLHQAVALYYVSYSWSLVASNQKDERKAVGGAC
jgi:hypothetical protein